MLSKKARLRQWRQETFGDGEGPRGGFEMVVGEEDGVKATAEAEASNVHEGERKRKRKRKGKKSVGEA